MKLARIYGHILLWLGFLSGALVSVRNTEIPDQPWATISWPSYLLALVVAVAGVVVLRSTKRAARAGSDKHKGDVAEMLAAVNRMKDWLKHWQSDQGKLQVHQVHRAIDEHLLEDLALFAELRDSLIDAFGLNAYASIMTEFALAERTINRTWSASADGYVDEVNSCLARAEAHFERAVQRMTDLMGEGTLASEVK